MQNVHVTGIDKLMRILLRGSSKAVDATRAALYQEASIIHGKAVKIVPFQYGTLAASGRVHDPVVQGRDILVEISFGGPARDMRPLNKGGTGSEIQIGYARVQHDNLKFKHAAGRQAEYLKQPVEEASKTLQDRLVKRVSAIIEGKI